MYTLTQLAKASKTLGITLPELDTMDRSELARRKRKMLFAFHPDKAKNQDKPDPDREEKFKQLSDAFDVLEARIDKEEFTDDTQNAAASSAAFTKPIFETAAELWKSSNYDGLASLIRENQGSIFTVIKLFDAVLNCNKNLAGVLQLPKQQLDAFNKLIAGAVQDGVLDKNSFYFLLATSAEPEVIHAYLAAIKTQIKLANLFADLKEFVTAYQADAKQPFASVPIFIDTIRGLATYADQLNHEDNAYQLSKEVMVDIVIAKETWKDKKEFFKANRAQILALTPNQIAELACGYPFVNKTMAGFTFKKLSNRLAEFTAMNAQQAAEQQAKKNDKTNDENDSQGPAQDSVPNKKQQENEHNNDNVKNPAPTNKDSFSILSIFSIIFSALADMVNGFISFFQPSPKAATKRVVLDCIEVALEDKPDYDSISEQMSNNKLVKWKKPADYTRTVLTDAEYINLVLWLTVDKNKIKLDSNLKEKLFANTGLTKPSAVEIETHKLNTGNRITLFMIATKARKTIGTLEASQQYNINLPKCVEVYNSAACTIGLPLYIDENQVVSDLNLLSAPAKEFALRIENGSEVISLDELNGMQIAIEDICFQFSTYNDINGKCFKENNAISALNGQLQDTLNKIHTRKTELNTSIPTPPPPPPPVSKYSSSTRHTLLTSVNTTGGYTGMPKQISVPGAASSAAAATADNTLGKFEQSQSKAKEQAPQFNNLGNELSTAVATNSWKRNTAKV